MPTYIVGDILAKENFPTSPQIDKIDGERVSVAASEKCWKIGFLNA
jgi:hypothetical protein